MFLILMVNPNSDSPSCLATSFFQHTPSLQCNRLYFSRTSSSQALFSLSNPVCRLLSPFRSERNPTRCSSTIKGTFPDRWSKWWMTAPPFWTSSTGGRFTPAGCWEAGGCSTSTPTTRAASTCWRRANTANRQTGALSAPPCSLFEGLPSSWRHFACKLPLWLIFFEWHITGQNVKTASATIKLKIVTIIYD